MHSDHGLNALGYYFGAQVALDTMAVRAASIGQELDPNTSELAHNAAEHIFPLTAADLMPALQGPALGKALKAAETRWIASGFTLTKADLIG
jgi:poly(A) polymerase